MEAEAFFGLEPTLNLGALVSAVVVENEMDIEFRGNLFLQLIQESDELLATMTWLATADDLPIEDIEGGKQGRGAVLFVIVCLAFR